jgi:aminoglycoside phosphotransferase (APT) family kinase protein
MGRMHDDEVDIDAALVRALVADQFPQWADLPVEPVESAGTVNAIYRLGTELGVRLPRTPGGVDDVALELRWLPELAPHLPLPVPVPVGAGRPGHGYAWPWSVYRWLDGTNPAIGGLADPAGLATDLAAFLHALHGIDTAGAPGSGRGVPLATRDSAVRRAIGLLAGIIDTAAATAAWEAALDAPEWTGHPCWVHADLSPGNLLMVDDRLAAVIDFGVMGIGEPAVDLITAWSLFDPPTREIFRTATKADDATWERGRGWALSIALLELSYYQETNPVMATIAAHVINEVLTDH